jgi:hypothetical protein
LSNKKEDIIKDTSLCNIYRGKIRYLDKVRREETEKNCVVKCQIAKKNEVESLEEFLQTYENLLFFTMPVYKVFITKADFFGNQGIIWVMQEGETLKSYIENNKTKENSLIYKHLVHFIHLCH